MADQPDDAAAWVVFAACATLGLAPPVAVLWFIWSRADTLQEANFTTTPGLIGALLSGVVVVVSWVGGVVPYYPFDRRRHPPRSLLRDVVKGAMFVTIGVWFVAGTLAIPGMNERFDLSPPSRAAATLVAVEEVTGAKGGRWTEWRVTGDFGARAELVFPKPAGIEAAPGAALDVTWRPGLMGLPWGTVRLADGEPPGGP